MKLLIKDILRFISFEFVDLLVKIKAGPVQEKTLAIVKLDVIGDYILFRNFIEELRKSEKYKNYKITLIGNSAYRELALGLDSVFVEHFVFINFKKMTRNLFYRYKVFSEIAKNGYEVIINPTYSREFNVTDSLVNVLNAKEKIGSAGTLGNIPQWQKSFSDKYYTKLLIASSEIKFEFLRNKEFFESLLGTQLAIQKPNCQMADNEITRPSKYVVIFPGASTHVRKWPASHFAEVAKYIIATYDCDVLVLGGPADLEDANLIQQQVQSPRLRNLAGQTSLLETVAMIKYSKLLISNETSAPHMAVMVDTPVIVIFNGNNFTRFIPYPEGMTHGYYPIYHPEVEKDFLAYTIKSNLPGYLSSLDMNEVKIQKVTSLISEHQDLLK